MITIDQELSMARIIRDYLDEMLEEITYEVGPNPQFRDHWYDQEWVNLKATQRRWADEVQYILKEMGHNVDGQA